MKSKLKRTELSIMNVILCFFVIFIHVSSQTITTADRSSPKFMLIYIIWRLCSCAVAGFVFLAGLKLSLGLEKPFSYPKYLLGRAKRVILPYIVSAAIYAIYISYKGYDSYTPKSFLYQLSTGTLTAHFYFVIMIVQFYLTAPLWRWLLKRLDSGIKAAIFLICSYFFSQIFGQYLADLIVIFRPELSFPYCDRIFTTYLFWWSGGLIAGRYYEGLLSELKKSFIPSLVLFIFTGAIDSILAYIGTVRGYYIFRLELTHDFYILAAILFLLALSERLSASRLTASILPLDSVSYSVYLYHPLLLYFADSLCYRLGAGMTAKLLSRMLYGYAITFIICLIPYAVRQIIQKRKGLLQ